ncbi:MSMEG_0570 family nitrogen starvation response protein [Ancylobacter pratisalsi]|uniref:MSMEG_0570 family nitrogen starvation response protein n=1 Tax=Ancylobacter pratisalsi TaxID=1745854 RepID=A0A6P1YMQ3_9HYPH|nr:MSMEG_0570 family nitrogen starvation response protein [Ancylobacter pratisalsi]QIB34230.1 MSMEG_0570 family nitrogen starvation response protein [Ancylobacter pratisalsi]
MPEMRFSIRWPDGRRERCYSPSLIVKDYFEPGQSYEISDFLAKSREALNIASQRVEARYGRPCSLALGQLARIEDTGQHFLTLPDARVLVEAFDE